MPATAPRRATRQLVAAVFHHGAPAPSLDDARVRVVRTDGSETIEDALHRRLGPAGLWGAAAGGTVLGLVTVAVALLLGVDVAPAAGVGAAVGLTGGPFFGSLAGFCAALHLNDRLRRLLGPDLTRQEATLVLAWARDTGKVRAALEAGGGDVA